MKKKLTFNTILLAVTLSFILLGCNKTDDTIDEGTGEERTKIIMEIPSGGNLDSYNWNNATLVWSQDFDDFSFKDNWVFEKNYNNPGNNDQLQKYTEENVELNNGTLKLYAKKVGVGQNKGDYTSSRLSGKFAFQYGRIEINAKLPTGEKPGIWFKLALLGNNIDVVGYPNSGEIDIMEYFSSLPNTYNVTVHSAANNENNGNLISSRNVLETLEEEFHTYGILWTNNYIKFYMDQPENIVYTLDRPSNATEFNWPFDQPFYLLIDTVVGGRYAGAQGVDDSMFPAVMEIDYIRVYHAK
ncbi:glycosyl hydrolase family 16 [Gillisia sp. Hel_I_86]|uniref:glycoside hydrolase family 16 protein n=1 Tax=Gillisia sp. Hel_I_86 TaxID=1249981 RepID=UPI00119BE3EF|nr:glycoside hydrolase family 16 protein [Gillisia sp. Hel_I_86]TVZ27516.1 glycosyl hydrolase family 16 [Gillisia sp. Hel_I_86]